MAFANALTIPRNHVGGPSKLREAGIVDCERQGLWAYYYVLPDALQELSAWLT